MILGLKSLRGKIFSSQSSQTQSSGVDHSKVLRKDFCEYLDKFAKNNEVKANVKKIFDEYCNVIEKNKNEGFFDREKHQRNFKEDITKVFKDYNHPKDIIDVFEILYANSTTHVKRIIIDLLKIFREIEIIPKVEGRTVSLHDHHTIMSLYHNNRVHFC